MDPNSTPGHRNSTPLPTLMREGKVGGLETLKYYEVPGWRLEPSTYGMPCAFGRSRMVT